MRASRKRRPLVASVEQQQAADAAAVQRAEARRVAAAAAVVAEATGEEYVTAAVAGRQWRIPADADGWPLSLILASKTVTQHGEHVVQPTVIVQALRQLLGTQWRDFVAAVRDRDQMIEATHAIAAAGGFPGTDDDLAWGKLPQTIAILTLHPATVESDLQRHWGVDYGDRWRYDAAGRRKLTLRQLHVRLQNLPADSSLAILLGRRSASELLLMDLWAAIKGQPHPARPMSAEQAAKSRAEQVEISKARAKYQERRNRDKTQRANARETALRNAADRKKRGA